MSANTPIRLAVFDCDGTLVDGQHAIIAAMGAAWEAFGLPGPDPEAVRRVVGLPLITAIAKLLPTAHEEDHVTLSRHYREAFHELRQGPDHHEPLYPGVTEALDALEDSGFLLGVATGKSRRGLEATLARHGLEARFVTLQTGDRGPGKPSPDMLLQAMAEVAAGPQTTVMIGDTVYDMEMARSAGAFAIAVSWGYHPSEELRAAGATEIVGAFAEIPAVAERLAGKSSGA
jgi:phosphoglycolate phosphatase